MQVPAAEVARCVIGFWLWRSVHILKHENAMVMNRRDCLGIRGGLHAGGGLAAVARDEPRGVWNEMGIMVIAAGGHRQLIVWSDASVMSLDPATGKPW